ncbi:MAG: hypothetical protein IJG81_08435 [Muribaculaceae bacterium]|nr:hypothetical protein [Muribaculaceae bacterium]
MKKIIFTLVCVMAAMTSISAQDGAKNLSQGQWNHGLAIGAQWIATDLGFAQNESQVISRTNENYSLDDLKVMYGARDKWVVFYDKLKKHENETGDIEKLVSTIAAEYDKGAVIKNGVKRDVEKYNASHSGDDVKTQPDEIIPNAAPEAGTDAAVAATDSTASAANAEGEAAEAKSEGDSSHGLLYILTILGLALGAIGTFLAMQARKENQEMARDNRDDINNMQKQIDKLRAALKGAPVADGDKGKKHHKHNNLDEKDGLAQTQKIEFDNKPAAATVATAAAAAASKKAEPKKEEPKHEAPVETKKEEPKQEPAKTSSFGEPRILFMAKPDEDDNFSRSSSQYEPGNSIFELTTMNGKSGSFSVINKTEAHKLALLMPGDTLTRACSGNNIQSTAGKSRIVTDRAGRAQLENGKWHIVVKAIVHYE